MFKKILKKKQFPGFSLLEIMAVVAIVAIGLVGTTQLVVQSLRAQSINRSTIIAYQLAQEGVELVRHLRDTNWQGAGVDWDEGIKEGSYCIDYRSPELKVITMSDVCRLYMDDDGWYYHPTISTNPEAKTAFSRIVYIIPIANTTDALKVRVTTIWQEGGKDNSYILETELFNWR